MLEDLQRELLERLPTLKNRRHETGQYERISVDEQNELVNEIKDSGAKIVFVGLGCPKQEVFVYEMREALLDAGPRRRRRAQTSNAGHMPQSPARRCSVGASNGHSGCRKNHDAFGAATYL